MARENVEIVSRVGELVNASCRTGEGEHASRADDRPAGAREPTGPEE